MKVFNLLIGRSSPLHKYRIIGSCLQRGLNWTECSHQSRLITTHCSIHFSRANGAVTLCRVAWTAPLRLLENNTVKNQPKISLAEMFFIRHQAHTDLYRVYTGSCPAWYRALRPHRIIACRSHRVLTLSSPCAHRLLWNMQCHSEIYIAALKYVLPLWNMYCHSEICIAALKYILPLWNMYCHSEICIATPKYVIQAACTRSQTITERVDVHHRPTNVQVTGG